jgi:anthranilate synthase component 1
LEEPRSNLDQPHFEEAVGRAKDYILAGEVFQVVLSRRYEFQIRGDLFGFYEALRRINPSPYMYYLKLGPRCIVGASPEMLVRVEGAQLETYPIAGTRPWTRDAEANAALTQELLRDPKDAAEHVMLVDLARNDVGRVAEYGSVSVPEYRVPHRFSHVQHLVSRVIGRLSPGVTAFDVLRALFPAGTVSGAPKVRAMEIIDELEPCRRGPYAGAVGYFSRTGSADFAITIRTLVASSGHASIQVGAGIVADSVPEHEWQETEHKAGALLTALQKART